MIIANLLTFLNRTETRQKLVTETGSVILKKLGGGNIQVFVDSRGLGRKKELSLGAIYQQVLEKTGLASYKSELVAFIEMLFAAAIISALTMNLSSGMEDLQILGRALLSL